MSFGGKIRKRKEKMEKMFKKKKERGTKRENGK
jgi:hypothetical protein